VILLINHDRTQRHFFNLFPENKPSGLGIGLLW
jgi:hypothetical protein